MKHTNYFGCNIFVNVPGSYTITPILVAEHEIMPH